MRSRPPQELAKRREIADPQPMPTLGYEGGFSFVRTVQPVFDRHCIRCHGLEAAEKSGKVRLNLIGVKAIQNLTDRKLVTWAEPYHETGASKTNDYFAIASPLTAILKRGHHDVKLSKDEWDALIVWMDLNVPHYSDGYYEFNRAEQRQPEPEGEKRLRAAIETQFGKAVAEQPFPALVNVGSPEKSRILQAALPADKGGWGQLEGGFKSAEDQRYQAMLALVQASIAPQAYHDMCGTCGRGKACECNSCWVRLGHFN